MTKNPSGTEQEEAAGDALAKLTELWTIQRTRVEKYANEAALEQAFIQPVLLTLGWKLKYQTFLSGREPDYALFLSDTLFDAALNVQSQVA